MKDISARELKGHNILAVERFKDSTRWMIEFVVLHPCSAYGSRGDEMRLFLAEDSYQNALQDHQRRKIKIKRYPHSAAYAREHGELEQYRASNNVNRQCKESIEAAVREHFDGMYLSHDAAKGVIETYGMERVSMVLSNTIQLQDWDGRYSRRNKEGAKTIPNENPETVRCGYALNSHPAVLNGFIDLVREEQQRSRTQREKLEPSRPSVRDKLKQELPAHKSAAPKKREPER